MRNEPGLINSFDIDGVIYMGKYGGVFPGPHDIIITGRSKRRRARDFGYASFKRYI